MNVKRSSMAVIGVLVVGAVSVTPQAAGAQTEPAAVPVTAKGAATPRTVTLVTGDRVTVGGSAGQVSAEPGPGRRGITFAVSTADGRVTVTPIDAIARVAAGVLD